MNAESNSRYREEFARLEPQLAGAELPWLRLSRRASLDRFGELGFPTTRDEAWKYTNVATIEKRPFRHVPASLDGASAAKVNELVLTGSRLLVFVNGRYAPGLSRIGALPAGALIGSLAAALADDAGRLEPLLASDVESFATGFEALNAAFWADGAYLDLASGVAIEEPVHLLFIATEADLETHPRNVIQAAAGSRVSIIEHYVGSDSAAYFTNAVTRIVAGQNAVVEHYKLQEEAGRAFHIAGLHAQQGPASQFTSHSFALGGALSRNEISTRFDAEGCLATLNGLYMAGGRQHVDHQTCIDHARPRGTSREVYKGVLDGAARAVFNGKIVVRPDAQKTDAHQSNRNLLLSEHAEVDTKPQLEIYADDVKCSHGATVGQLDESQIFYLRARGVDEAAARSLLTFAFAEEIVRRADIAPLRTRLEALLINRLADAQLPGAWS
jgi:Fe-S cluster assembly protein SufD